MVGPPDVAFMAPPDPGQVHTLDAVSEWLRRLKAWAGDPSYEVIKNRINEAWTASGRPPGELARRATVADCFKAGRRRLNTDLVVAIVEALNPDVGYVAQWRQALRVVGGETQAGAQVRVQDTLPPDPPTFIGRAAELDRLCQAHRPGGELVSVVEGMAGVGKTRLAVHAGYLLGRQAPFDRVLFVDLRGFGPDPAQPPADPGAVLDGFLRLLGLPARQIPHDLDARAAAYRRLLAGVRALVVLDNAANEDQVRPLLPGGPRCVTWITSRRRLPGLPATVRFGLDVFNSDEALCYLARSAPDVPIGGDPDAATRIIRRCGRLPLALGLVVGHMWAKPEWTLTDHADRLDERHGTRLLDGAVDLAFTLSYQHLPADRQRLLRLAALHPGDELDDYAAAALAGLDLAAARAWLGQLRRDHLLQARAPGRYAFHDLVRGYAAGRACDEDRLPYRRAALTRLFDHYLATAVTAMDGLYPGQADQRPRVAAPGTPAPDLTGPGAASRWLDTELPTLMAVAAHAAGHGWPAHAVRLSAVLSRYLLDRQPEDARRISGYARDAARGAGDVTGEAHALAGLGGAEVLLGDHRSAAEHFARALVLFRRTGDELGRAYALTGLGTAYLLLGRHAAAAYRHQQALVLFRRTGHRTGEAETLNRLGSVEAGRGRHLAAADWYRQALRLSRQLDDRTTEAWTLNGLGTVDTRFGNHARAVGHLTRAVALFRELGNRTGETWTLNSLGTACRAAGRPADAVVHHTTAHRIAVETAARDQHANAHAGLGDAYRILGQPTRAGEQYRQALALYTELGMSEADLVRARLGALAPEPDPCRVGGGTGGVPDAPAR